jgi:hypothetical protein
MEVASTPIPVAPKTAEHQPSPASSVNDDDDELDYSSPENSAANSYSSKSSLASTPPIFQASTTPLLNPLYFPSKVSFKSFSPFFFFARIIFVFTMFSMWYSLSLTGVNSQIISRQSLCI